MIARQKKSKTAFWIGGCIGLLMGGFVAVFGFARMSAQHDSPGAPPRTEIICETHKEVASNVVTEVKSKPEPIIIIDGVRVFGLPYMAINHMAVESSYFLEEQEAVRKYGEDAAGGAHIISIKKSFGGDGIDYSHPNGNKTTTYMHVEEMPEFPGGDEALIQWLQESIIYPDEAREKSIEGMVVVRFVVDAEGNVVEPVVIKSPHELLSAEALRIVSTMPKWKPGKQNGIPVRIYYIAPIKFNE